MFLGMLRDPRQPQPKIDAEAAHETIEILTLLREKTTRKPHSRRRGFLRRAPGRAEARVRAEDQEHRMKRRLAAVALACAAHRGRGRSARAADGVAARPLAAGHGRGARRRFRRARPSAMGELLATGRTYGIKTFPQYAASAAGLASETEKSNPELAAWAAKTAGAARRAARPPSRSPKPTRAATQKAWGEAIPLVLRASRACCGDYRTERAQPRRPLHRGRAGDRPSRRSCSRIALFIRYGRVHGARLPRDAQQPLQRRLGVGARVRAAVPADLSLARPDVAALLLAGDLLRLCRRRPSASPSSCC